MIIPYYGNESSIYYIIRYNHRVTVRQVFASEVHKILLQEQDSCHDKLQNDRIVIYYLFCKLFIRLGSEPKIAPCHKWGSSCYNVAVCGARLHYAASMWRHVAPGCIMMHQCGARLHYDASMWCQAALCCINVAPCDASCCIMLHQCGARLHYAALHVTN